MLIGILGEAGSGKDEAARYLVQKLGFYSVAIADPIKIYCGWMFGWDAERLYGPSDERNKGDDTYPFVRCPSCGFTLYSMGPMDPKANSVECGLCGSVRAPQDWEADLSPRFALQSLGDWARNFNQDAYVNFALLRARAVAEAADYDPLWEDLARLGEIEHRWQDDPGEPVDRVVISDVRLTNEVMGIQRARGKVYRIRRSVRKDSTTTGIPKHNSEVQQRAILDEQLDGVIENDSTLDDLHTTLRGLVIKGKE